MTPTNFEAQAREWVEKYGCGADKQPRDLSLMTCEEVAFEAGYRAGVLAAANVAEEYWKSGKNQYARHSGRAVESRIKALIEEAKQHDSKNS